MRPLQRALTHLFTNPSKPFRTVTFFTTRKTFSTGGDAGGGGGDDGNIARNDTNGSGNLGSMGSVDNLGWDTGSTSWSTGLTKEHFDGEVVGMPVGAERVENAGRIRVTDPGLHMLKQAKRELEEARRRRRAVVDGWEEKMDEMSVLVNQIREPGARGSYLKSTEKDEMYKKHKENPEEYTVERLAKEYRIMRQRVHAILWLKEIEEEEEKMHGPLNPIIDLFLDYFPEKVKCHDREFHVASLPYKPDFKVMPEGWDGTTRDPDEVHYEISMKEDEMLYQEFVRNMNFNKMKMAKQVKCHKYSRRRPSEGWNFTVEKLGQTGKRGNGGGWKFVSKADGSSRPLNEYEKIFVKRETPRRRRRISQ